MRLVTRQGRTVNEICWNLTVRVRENLKSNVVYGDSLFHNMDGSRFQSWSEFHLIR